MAHGSVQNMLAGGSATKPELGMGATHIGWTDRHPYTIVAVISPKEIVVQEDNYTRTGKNGMSESQAYEFIPNPEAEKIPVTLRKNGKWIQSGQSMKNGRKFVIGYRDKYHDYSF